MKKYFFAGSAMLVFSAFMASCSHDDFDYSSIVESKKAAFQEVFVKTYGSIDPNQTWGFGSTAVTAVTKGLTRAIQPSFNFPSDADASKFLSDVPAGVAKLAQNVDKANNWIDETWTGDINIWGGGGTAENGWQSSGGTLYIKGNCDFSNRSFYFMGNSELYLVAGATLTLAENNGSGNLQQNTKIYIAEGAKLVAKGELKLNNGLHIYNHGTIEAPKLSTNSNSVLYNVGTVKVENKISVENDLSVVVNDGTITATDLNTAGSGKFENNDKVTITGTTFVNSNSNAWVNNGDYHTGNFLYNAASDDVINNCRLTVDKDFNINLGDNPGNGNFKMDAGSSVVTKNFNGGGKWADTYAGTWSAFNGGPFYIYMGANSVFKVTETATMNATKADYGVYGPETGAYAVFQAKKIVAGAANQGYEVTYGGNLVVSTESHFANGYSGTYPYIDFKGNAKVYAPGFETGEPEIYIPETECNPGFGTGSGEGETVTITIQKETTTLESGRVFCEDLGQISTNDLDFNDAVFDAYVYKVTPSTQTIVKKDGEVVSDETIEGESTYKTVIVLLAAGGTLPLTVAGIEVHDALDHQPTSTIINTITSPIDRGSQNHWTQTKAPVILKNGDSYFFSYSSIVEIPIVVNYGNEILELKAEQGWAPHKILVPIGTKWCKERYDIATVYTNFKDYVGSSQKFWEGSKEENRLYTSEGSTYDLPEEVKEEVKEGTVIISEVEE